MFIKSYNPCQHNLQGKDTWREVVVHLDEKDYTNGKHFDNIMELSMHISNYIDRSTHIHHITLLNK